MFNGGLEILVSAFRALDFGVVLSLGAGGALTELIDDKRTCAEISAQTEQFLWLSSRLHLTRSPPREERTW
jgi:hypothetical protein